ncbi:MAG: tRNA 2-thiouridine(34) synthase MnmA [bacterium]|nr:tRNA 2-thiouridine(34) synthase MnmA [bacterium]
MASKNDNKKSLVYVALSGGVDSAMAGALLLKQKCRVVGVYMRQYDTELGQSDNVAIECSWQKDRRDAISVAAHLDIPFREWDFRKEYHKDVVDYMITEYKAGRTPNPDVMCNTYIKFGAFLDRALKEGADFIATGHYARVKRDSTVGAQLLQAVDTNKDQTYFLWGLSQKQLAHCLFPVGDYKKPHVRMMAKKWGIPTADKKDSQGVCFIGKISMQDFLQSKIKPKKGVLMTPDGKKVGEHDGAWYYTIGQRHGIGFRGGDQSYVVLDKDIKKNIVYVVPMATEKEHFKSSLKFARVHWIEEKLTFPLKCTARVRYREELGICTVHKIDETTYEALFTQPRRAIAPGQALVMYKGQKVLGGGLII